MNTRDIQEMRRGKKQRYPNHYKYGKKKLSQQAKQRIAQQKQQQEQQYPETLSKIESLPQQTKLIVYSTPYLSPNELPAYLQNGEYYSFYHKLYDYLTLKVLDFKLFKDITLKVSQGRGKKPIYYKVFPFLDKISDESIQAYQKWVEKEALKNKRTRDKTLHEKIVQIWDDYYTDKAVQRLQSGKYALSVFNGENIDDEEVIEAMKEQILNQIERQKQHKKDYYERNKEKIIAQTLEGERRRKNLEEYKKEIKRQRGLAQLERQRAKYREKLRLQELEEKKKALAEEKEKTSIEQKEVLTEQKQIPTEQKESLAKQKKAPTKLKKKKSTKQKQQEEQ